MAVPLISPSSSLPPSLHCLSSSRLVTVLSAACSAVYTRPAWGPGGWRGRHKEGMQKKKKGDFEVQARLVVLQQTIQEINFYELQCLLSPATQRKPPSVQSIHPIQRDRKRKGEEGRVTAMAATWCPARRHGRVRSTSDRRDRQQTVPADCCLLCVAL